MEEKRKQLDKQSALQGVVMKNAINIDKTSIADIVDYGDEVGLDEIEEIEQRSYQVIQRLRETVFSPDKEKELRRTFSITEAAEMVGRTPTAVRDAEKDGRLPESAKDARGRRTGYTLEGINKMREVFGTLPYRDTNKDEVAIIPIQNFKGGVGKSTITVHVAQYFALRGYRVCVVDCDPQGSTTSYFGVNPDYDLTEEDTLYPYLSQEVDTLHYAVRDTYWDQLKLVPANLSLYGIEYELAARLPNNPKLLERLRTGIDTIKDDYDIVLIDPPPALGMISLSVLRAANALIVPVRPATIDFGSTAHFFTMLIEALRELREFGMEPRYKFLKILANNMNEGKSAHVEIAKMMQQVYGSQMLNTIMKDSAEIDNAGGRLMTVYELEGPMTSRETHNRCKAYLDAMCEEIEVMVRKTWPSHRESLRKEGLI